MLLIFSENTSDDKAKNVLYRSCYYVSQYALRNFQQVCTNRGVRNFPENFYYFTECFHASNSSFLMMKINATSFSNSRIWGHQKYVPALLFSYVSLENFVQRYLKHFLSLCKALTNCFINLNCLCDGAKRTFALFTNGEFLMFFLPNTNIFLLFHFLLIQYFCLTLLSH